MLRYWGCSEEMPDRQIVKAVIDTAISQPAGKRQQTQNDKEPATTNPQPRKSSDSTGTKSQSER